MSAPMTPPGGVTRGEVFAPVAGFPGYFVSDAGRVLSVKRGAPRLLAPLVKSNGYISANLSRRTVTVHTLVAEAFLGPRPAGEQVRHLDGDCHNNVVTNLSWGTRSENELDKVRHGTHQNSRKTHCSKGHAFDEANTRLYRGERVCRACSSARVGQRRAA